MIKILGILCLAIFLYVALLASDPQAAFSLNTQQMLSRQIGLAGILILGVAPLIISGGIDLSLGSVLCLSAVGFALIIKFADIPPVPAAVLVVAAAPLIGLFQGLLVTKLRLQPFLATLFGLFIFRGVARSLSRFVQGTEGDVNLSGLPLEYADQLRGLTVLVRGSVFGIHASLLLFLGLAVLVGIFLHATVYGRYFYAIGANEQAARYAGIATDRYKVLAYMWASTMAGLAGVLFMLDIGSANPSSSGAFYELYAITGAVLGGCSLRGGEGRIVGIVLGATVLPLLRNLTLFYGVPDVLEFILVGVALLLGTVLDEVFKRRGAARV